MQNLIEFLELDRDGTWAVVLFLAAVLLFIWGVKELIICAIEEIKFRKEYGMSTIAYNRRQKELNREYRRMKASSGHKDFVYLSEKYGEKDERPSSEQFEEALKIFAKIAYETTGTF